MFLVVYVGLDLVCNVWLGWLLEVSFYYLENGSLLVFVLFMFIDFCFIFNVCFSCLIWVMAIVIFSLIL